MDEELKDAIKDVCAAIALNMYQSTGLTPGRDQETMDKAKLEVMKYIEVEDCDAVILVRFDKIGLITVPPFYGMIPATIMTEKYKKCCDGFFSQSSVIGEKSFTYII